MIFEVNYLFLTSSSSTSSYMCQLPECPGNEKNISTWITLGCKRIHKLGWTFSGFS